MSNPIESYIEVLQQVPLFDAINEEELIHILGCLKPNIRQYNKGEIITIEGHEFTGIGIVLNGRVTVTKTNEAGERILMAQLPVGGIFGEMVAFSFITKWPATVVADRKSIVMSLSPNTIVNHCSNMCYGHRQLMINLLTLVSNKAIGLNRKVHYLSIKSMRGKLAKFLMEEYAGKGKKLFDISYNRNELAEFLNVSRPSMSRELSRMKDEGIIDFYQSSFKLLNIDALSDYASHLK